MNGNARQQTKVLVVDDDAMIRDIIRGILTDDEFVTIEAKDASTGLEAAIEHSPQLVIVDMRMPRMSGLDFLKAVRAHPDIKHIPDMVVTAYRSAADGVECLRAGAAAYIQKPLDFPAFRLQVKQILGHPLDPV